MPLLQASALMADCQADLSGEAIPAAWTRSEAQRKIFMVRPSFSTRVEALSLLSELASADSI